MLRQLQERHPHLAGGGPPEGVFASRSKNRKKEGAAAAYLHNDSANLAYGWCAIQALGNFNPKTGGHIVLQQLGLVVEFPPGSTILIPSATVTHGNVPVCEGETRASLVHFTAAGLFRWVEYGFCTERSIRESDPDAWKKLQAERKGKRFDDALGMFSKLHELDDDRRNAFNL